jgi:hypothetical protein
MWLLSGMIAIAALLSGRVPLLLAAKPEMTWSHAAQAQQVTDQELRQYGQALLIIEPMRQAAYDEIKRILGTADVPAIACHRPSSLNNLRPEIREIAITYCNRSIEVVERFDLTITQFNRITVQLQRNSDLASRLQEILVQLQQ